MTKKTRTVTLEFEEVAYGGWVARHYETWKYEHGLLAVIPALTDMGQFLDRVTQDSNSLDNGAKEPAPAPAPAPEPASSFANTPEPAPAEVRNDVISDDIAAEEAARLDKERSWKEL